MATEVKIMVYGTPEGWKPPTEKQSHSTTYLEYEVPNKIYNKLRKLINNELKQFRNDCKCQSCKRKNKSLNK